MPDTPKIRESSSSMVERVLRDPSASFWLKAALRDCLDRDIVDAATDAVTLAEILNTRAQEMAEMERTIYPVRRFKTH